MSGRRRLVLASLAVLTAAGHLAAEPGAPARHVVWVLLGGAPSAAELEDEAGAPHLAALAASGRALALGADWTTDDGGARVLLTGWGDEGRPGPGRPVHPTVLERARGDGGLPAGAVWFVTHAGDDGLLVARSDDAAYGAGASPSLAHGDGLFAEPLRPVLEVFGRPLPTEEASWRLLSSLRARSRAAAGAWLPPDVDAGTPAADAVERAVLGELDRRAALARGPVPDDVRATRTARTVLAVERPRLLVLRLGGLARAADADARSAALRATDALVGEIEAEARAVVGEGLVLVVAATRPASGTATVPVVVVGDGVEARAHLRGRPRGVDLAPTLAHHLGLPAVACDGAVLQGLLRTR